MRGFVPSSKLLFVFLFFSACFLLVFFSFFFSFVSIVSLFLMGGFLGWQLIGVHSHGFLDSRFLFGGEGGSEKSRALG